MSYINRLTIFPEKERQALDLMFKDIYFGKVREHDHSSSAQGGKLDWDTAWSDAVHSHASAAEGGQLDWDNVWSDAVHTHQSNAEGGTLDHGLALTGLTDDDHTQYALLAGRSGGQTLIGGTAANDDLVLQSSSNATRGEISIVDSLKLTQGKHLYFDTDLDSSLSASADDQIDLTINGSILLRYTAVDYFTASYQDYSASSTVTGWSSFTTKLIYYKKMGNNVRMWVNLSGTSNATTVSFTLPYTTHNSVQVITFCAAADNGANQATSGYLTINPNSATANVYKDAAITAWTNSGTKSVTGEFFFQAD